MSLFQKLVFKTFLFLALFCFFSSSVFASKTLTYYSSTTNITSSSVCSTQKDTVCQAVYKQYVPSPVVDYGSSVLTYTYVGCPTGTTSYNVLWNVKTDRYGPTIDSPKALIGSTTTQSGSGAAYVKTLTCPDDEELKLDGCTATCVPDPCKSLKGGTFTKNVECGSVTCPNGGVIVDGGILSCSKGAGLWLPRPLQATSNPSNSCEGSIDNSIVPTSVQVKNSAIGSSSTTGYCSATYIYAGSSGSATASESDLVSMAFSSVTETTEDGQCPSGTKKGSYALGENGATKWVCVPDSGSSTDPTDPTDPQNCPTGQHKDTTTGQCVPDTNTGGGGSGGSGDGGGGDGDSGGSGGGGGSNCNAQTGAGCNNSSPDSDTDGDGLADKDDPLTDSDGDGDADKGDYYSDNCEKTPNCTADPVQCAILRGQWKANCEANRPMSQGEKDLVSSALSKQDAENASAASEFSNKVNQIINDNALFNNSTPTEAACIPDKQVPIFGSFSVTVKYSLLCPYFSLLRSILILVAYMFAARIVYAEITGGGIRV